MPSSASDRPTGADLWLTTQVARAHEDLGKLVPRHYWPPIELHPEAAAWAAEPDPGSLFLTGNMGVGKTHTAWQAIRAWHQTWFDVPQWRGLPRIEAWRSTALFDALRPEAEEDGRRVAARAQRADLLYLDDLAAARANDWTRERLFEIVDERYAQNRPILITSDVFPADLGPYIGPRVASRLAEMLADNIVLIEGGDRRRGGDA
ncbi:DnaA ATPase domain-containing protein [Embleya sp. NPDC001921]